MYILGIVFRGDIVLYFLLYLAAIFEDIFQMEMTPYFEGTLYTVLAIGYCFAIASIILFLCEFKIKIQIFLIAFCVNLLNICYFCYADTKGVCLHILAMEFCWPLCISFIWLVLRFKSNGYKWKSV